MKFSNRIKKLYQNGTNANIIRGLSKAAPFAAKQFKEHWQQHPLQLQNILALSPINQVKKAWELSRINSTYKADTLDQQNIKLPGAFLKIRQNDCKSFSTFIGGFLSSLKIRNGFVYCAYTPRAKQATHVYNYAEIDGERFPVDGCLPTFGKKIKTKETFTKFIENMDVNIISGVGSPRRYNYGYNEESTAIGKRFRDKIKDKVKEKIDKTKATVQNIIDDPGKGIKNLITDGKGKVQGLVNKAGKVVKVGKTVGLAPGRTAFLGLVKLNFRNLAVKLAEVREKDPASLYKFWDRLGGAKAKIDNSISQGKIKPRILGFDELDYISEAATAATALTAAAPIILAVVNFLMKYFKKDKDLEGLGKEAEATGEDPLGANFKDETPDPGASGRPAPTGNITSGDGFGLSTPVLIGGGILLAGVLYMATKKGGRK